MAGGRGAGRPFRSGVCGVGSVHALTAASRRGPSMRGPRCRSALAALTVLFLLGTAAGAEEAPRGDAAVVEEAAFGLGAAAAALPAGSADVTVEDDVAAAPLGEQEAEGSGEARSGSRWDWSRVTGAGVGLGPSCPGDVLRALCPTLRFVVAGREERRVGRVARWSTLRVQHGEMRPFVTAGDLKLRRRDGFNE